MTADQQSNPPGKWSEVDKHGKLRDDGHNTRHPNADESAFIRARDRTCRAPHCRTPATRCDLDHATEHHNGGPSHRGNCRCLCRNHHTLRHAPGVHVKDHGLITVWTTPDGHTYEVCRDMPTTKVTIETPLSQMTAPMLDGKKIVLISILRAGNGILDGMLEILPSARVGHIGLYRDPKTLVAVEYYYKVPDNMQDRDAIVVTPDVSDEAARRYRWDPEHGRHVFIHDEPDDPPAPPASQT